MAAPSSGLQTLMPTATALMAMAMLKITTTMRTGLLMARMREGAPDLTLLIRRKTWTERSECVSSTDGEHGDEGANDGTGGEEEVATPDGDGSADGETGGGHEDVFGAAGDGGEEGENSMDGMGSGLGGEEEEETGGLGGLEETTATGDESGEEEEEDPFGESGGFGSDAGNSDDDLGLEDDDDTVEQSTSAGNTGNEVDVDDETGADDDDSGAWSVLQPASLSSWMTLAGLVAAGAFTMQAV